MAGGEGDDIYHVDDLGDQVLEALNAGTDTVRVFSGTYSLGANVENLELVGSAWMAVGNALANVITVTTSATSSSAPMATTASSRAAPMIRSILERGRTSSTAAPASTRSGTSPASAVRV